MFLSKEAIAEAAMKARDGDPGARDSITCYCISRVADADRTELVKLFRAYVHDTAELARTMHLERPQQNAAFEDCAVAAAQGDPQQTLKARQFMLKMAIEAPHAVFLSLHEQPHITIGGPKQGPPENRFRVNMG
jgi:hypothetical protein